MTRQCPTALFVFPLAVALALTPALAACTTAPRPDSTGSALAQAAEEEIVENNTDTDELEKPSQPIYLRVPNVTADDAQAAETILENEGFSVITVSDWSVLYTDGHVAAQSPSGYAPRGTCITLTISRGASPYAADIGPETRDIPDVRGYPVNEALIDLEEHDFEVTSIDGPEDGIVTSYEVTGTGPFSAVLHTCPVSGGSYDASTPSSMQGE